MHINIHLLSCTHVCSCMSFKTYYTCNTIQDIAWCTTNLLYYIQYILINDQLSYSKPASYTWDTEWHLKHKHVYKICTNYREDLVAMFSFELFAPNLFLNHNLEELKIALKNSNRILNRDSPGMWTMVYNAEVSVIVSSSVRLQLLRAVG